VNVITPSIDVTKSANPTSIQNGAMVTYSYTVKNTGDCTLTGVTVVDDKVAGVQAAFEAANLLLGNPATTLHVGDLVSFSVTVAVTGSGSGDITNTVTATGTDPLGETVDDDAQATVRIERATPKVVTTIMPTDSITLGDTVHDEVTVTGIAPPFAAPTGDVQFYLDGVAYGPPVAIDSGGWARSLDYKPMSVGSHNFYAIYLGDSNYLTKQSADEPLSMKKATPTVVTLLSASEIVLGESVTDEVIVTGLSGIVPTGDVEFYVSHDGGVTWTKYGSTKQLDGAGHAVSDSYKPASGGDYLFKAVYLGDSNYKGASSDPTSEPLKVTVPYKTRTLGYWKNHPGKWPVGAGCPTPKTVFPWLVPSLAGKTYMDVLKMQPKGDATIQLAHQYIAAVLNACAFTAPDDVMEMIDHAEGLFDGSWDDLDHGYPVGSKPLPSDPIRAEIISLACQLDQYNNMYDMW
jgi:hypothetical protein